MQFTHSSPSSPRRAAVTGRSGTEPSGPYSFAGPGISRPGVRPTTPLDRDHIVQQTDIDASGSRLAAVLSGYLVDPYAALLHGGGENDHPRRFPLINRGTYTRTTAIDDLVLQFLKSLPTTQKKQVVSLGAGSDTRYWRLKETGGSCIRNWIYHELDFAEVARRKAERVKKWDVLSRPLGRSSYVGGWEVGENEEGENSRSATPTPASIQRQSGRSSGSVHIDVAKATITSPDYHLHAIDIRNLKSVSSSSPLLPPSIDRTIPTLIISECCLIYLSPTDADAILTYFTSTFTSSHPLAITLYEPIGSDDAFGKVMIQNLATRGIVLQTLKKYSTLLRQRERLRVLGFKGGQATADVDWIWENWVSSQEKERLAKLEILDEVEEWKLLARHYCVVWGWRNGDANEPAWNGWSNIPVQNIDE